jgi:hypothetical protein
MGAIMFCIAVIVAIVCGAGFIGGIVCLLWEIAKFWSDLTIDDNDKFDKG